MSEPIILALTAALSALLGTGVSAFIAWRKWPTERSLTEADAAAKLTGAAASFIDDLREQIRDHLNLIRELQASDKAKDRTIKEQDERIDQLITDQLWAQQQMRRLEEENKRMRERDAEMLVEIRKLRLALKQAGWEEDELPGEITQAG